MDILYRILPFYTDACLMCILLGLLIMYVL